ncbi:hypothetical protein HOA55_00690 [archaeon]|jgi:hypothetical protein|nr:hypothetical protein [archaeon]MBT3578227.1 hypothetical protein [archaeon]MBT6819852.1 hypothetical protein [archaeon]MBT6955739.1 hypothetical protein [archaeon]MBT7025634.1 hypothetical protein [archaeon]
MLKGLIDAFRVLVGRKIPQSTIDRLQSSGRSEVPYRGKSLETFGTGFLLRDLRSDSHPCYDPAGYYNGKIDNSF